MATITTRSGKGSPLTSSEVDSNFNNLNTDKQEVLSEGSFANGDKTKLDGIEASADVTDATNVTAAGALMDSEVTNLAQVKAFDSSDYATAAQGTTADNALPKAGGTMTGNIKLNDDVDIRMGAGNDFKLFHNGTNSKINNNTGALQISNFANDQDVTIATDDGSGATAVYFRADGSTGDAILSHYGTEKIKTQSGGVDVTGNITVSGTVDGRDLATDGTKLDGIEASADVTDTANVTSAGALMTSGGTVTSATTPLTATTSSSSGESAATFKRSASNGSLVTFENSVNVTVGVISTVSNDLLIGTGDTGLYFEDSTNEIEPFNPTNRTSTNGVISLGASNRKFKDLYLGGNITVDGTVDGRDLATDGTKLDGIADDATANPNAIDGVTIQEEGSSLSTAATTLNFVGTGVTASGTGATKTITVSGGGSGITVEDEGSALSTSATTLNFTGAGVTASGTGATKTVTIAGASTSPDTKVLLSTTTVSSAVASVDFDSSLITDTYTTYWVKVNNMTVDSTNTALNMRLGTSNTIDTANNYVWRQGFLGIFVGDSFDQRLSADSVDSRWLMSDDDPNQALGNDSTMQWSASWKLYNLRSTTTGKGCVIWDESFGKTRLNFYNTYTIQRNLWLYQVEDTKVNFIRLYLSNGNIASGVFRLYGSNE